MQLVHDTHNLQKANLPSCYCRSLLCTTNPSKIWQQLLFGPTSSTYLFIYLASSHSSWSTGKLARLAFVCRKTKIRQLLLVPPLPSFPNHHGIAETLLENLLLKQNKTLHLFWVFSLRWSLAQLHNSLLKPFYSNICMELCKVICVRCQASLRFALALTPSVKIRQWLVARVNPYRYLWLSDINMQL